jgi:hypothetical protein
VGVKENHTPVYSSVSGDYAYRYLLSSGSGNNLKKRWL